MLKSLFRPRGVSNIVALVTLGFVVGIVRFQLTETDLRHARTYFLLYLLGASAYICGMVTANAVLIARETRHRRRGHI